MTLEARPITLREARRWIAEHHRHNIPPHGWLFGTSAWEPLAGVLNGTRMVGVGIAGRPVGRGLDDGRSVELLRVCTTGADNACSFLYGALCRAAFALGHRRAFTYTLASEPGTSLRAAGFRLDALLPARDAWLYTDQGRYDRDLFGEARHAQDEPKVRWLRTPGPQPPPDPDLEERWAALHA